MSALSDWRLSQSVRFVFCCKDSLRCRGRDSCYWPVRSSKQLGLSQLGSLQFYHYQHSRSKLHWPRSLFRLHLPAFTLFFLAWRLLLAQLLLFFPLFSLFVQPNVPQRLSITYLAINRRAFNRLAISFLAIRVQLVNIWSNLLGNWSHRQGQLKLLSLLESRCQGLFKLLMCQDIQWCRDLFKLLMCQDIQWCRDLFKLLMCQDIQWCLVQLIQSEYLAILLAIE